MICRTLEALPLALRFSKKENGMESLTLDRDALMQKDKEAADELLAFVDKDKAMLSENGTTPPKDVPEAAILREGILSFKFSLRDAEALFMQLKEREFGGEISEFKGKADELLLKIPHAYSQLDTIVESISRA